jgi:hypothetical protein
MYVAARLPRRSAMNNITTHLLTKHRFSILASLGVGSKINSSSGADRKLDYDHVGSGKANSR